MSKRTWSVIDAVWATLMSVISLIAFAEGAEWTYSLVAAALLGWSVVLTGRGE